MLILKWISNKKAGMKGLSGFLTQHPDINELCFSHKSVSCLVLSDSLWPHGLYSTRLLCPWKSPEKNTRVGGQSLLQENFPTPGSNPGISHCMDCTPQGSSVHGSLQRRILEWVAIPFSRRTSQPQDRIQVSHIAGDSLPPEPEPSIQWTFIGHSFSWCLLV